MTDLETAVSADRRASSPFLGACKAPKLARLVERSRLNCTFSGESLRTLLGSGLGRGLSRSERKGKGGRAARKAGTPEGILSLSAFKDEVRSVAQREYSSHTFPNFLEER